MSKTTAVFFLFLSFTYGLLWEFFVWMVTRSKLPTSWVLLFIVEWNGKLFWESQYLSLIWGKIGMGFASRGHTLLDILQCPESVNQKKLFCFRSFAGLADPPNSCPFFFCPLCSVICDVIYDVMAPEKAVGFHPAAPYTK